MTDAAEPDPETSVAARLLALQHIDTQADQLRVKRERLPEREQLAAQEKQITAWEQRSAQVASSTRQTHVSDRASRGTQRRTELKSRSS